MSGECSRHGEMRNAYKISVRKFAGKRPLGRHGRELSNNKWILKKKAAWTGFI
jgi:hypothetical protein